MSVANRNGKLALNAITPAIPTPRLANPTSALERAVFPPDKLCGYVAKEDMEYEIDQVVYSNREKQVVREKCFAHFADLQRFWLI